MASRLLSRLWLYWLFDGSSQRQPTSNRAHFMLPDCIQPVCCDRGFCIPPHMRWAETPSLLPLFDQTATSSIQTWPASSARLSESIALPTALVGVTTARNLRQVESTVKVRVDSTVQGEDARWRTSSTLREAPARDQNESSYARPAVSEKPSCWSWTCHGSFDRPVTFTCAEASPCELMAASRVTVPPPGAVDLNAQAPSQPVPVASNEWLLRLLEPAAETASGGPVSRQVRPSRMAATTDGRRDVGTSDSPAGRAHRGHGRRRPGHWIGRWTRPAGAGAGLRGTQSREARRSIRSGEPYPAVAHERSQKSIGRRLSVANA